MEVLFNEHDVLFAVEANFEQRLRSLGFPVRVLTGDQAEALGPYRHQIFNSDQPLTSLKLLVDRYILPTLPVKVAELREICQEADLLISVASQFAASIVAEMLHLPWIAVILTPSKRSFRQAQVMQENGMASLCAAVERVLHDKREDRT